MLKLAQLRAKSKLRKGFGNDTSMFSERHVMI